MKEKTLWWRSASGKEVARSISIINSAALCGLCIREQWYVCAGCWAGWAFVCGVYLIGVYIEENTQAQLAAMEYWNAPQQATRLMVEEDV